MPPPWARDAAWTDRDGGWSVTRGDGPGAGVPRALRLWLPVVISFLVQVPAVAYLVWRTHDVPTGPILVALALLGPLALIGARRFPGPVVAVVSVAAALLLVLRPDFAGPNAALAFAIILGIVRGARIWVYSSVGAVWVATIAVGGLVDLALHPLRIAFTTLGLALAMGVGEAIRTRRERFREYRRIAAARRLTAEQRERMRIARELHDVLAHSLSQINVQAGVGLHLIDSQPEKAAEALANIKGASKNALDEVRTVLGILRSDQGDDVAPLVPEPDLAGIPALVHSFRAQGLGVEFVSELEPEASGPAPAATQLALYRICQEALTNVLRHARASVVTVRLRRDGDDYVLTVVDDGAAVPAAQGIEPGRGLLGMRERAELLGGSLQVARLEAGGFRAEARIPRSGRPVSGRGTTVGES